MPVTTNQIILLAIIALPLLYLAYRDPGLVIVILALAYPSFKTAQAYEHASSTNSNRWLVYWTMVCVSYWVWFIVDILFFWLPGYLLFWIEALYVIWLQSPPQYTSNIVINVFDFIRDTLRQTQIKKMVKEQLVAIKKCKSINRFLHNNKRWHCRQLTKFEKIKSVEEAGIKREHVFWAILAIPLFALALWLKHDLVMAMLVLIYPGIKTSESDTQGKDVDPKIKSRWLSYWVMICISYFVGLIVDCVFYWLSGWFWLKACYVLWLQLPPPISGTYIIYESFLAAQLKIFLPKVIEKVKEATENSEAIIGKLK